MLFHKYNFFFIYLQTTNPYVFTLEENLPINFPIGQVVAQDKDVGENALLYYYIVGKYLKLFMWIYNFDAVSISWKVFYLS